MYIWDKLVAHCALSMLHSRECFVESLQIIILKYDMLFTLLSLHPALLCRVP